MNLCYQVATPDVAIADSVTAYQGPLKESFHRLARLGYDGVELMTLNPSELDWEEVKQEGEKNNLIFSIVCTGEIFGQLGLSYSNPDEANRREAVRRTKEIIDFAGYLGADINIGRIRGQYCAQLTKEQTETYAVNALQELSDYAAPKNVRIALETVTIMQTNFINTMAEAERLMKWVDRPNFRLMMDVFHMNLEEKDMVQAIRDYSKYNIHVHLADNNRRYPGQCGLDFEKILTVFKECGYDGNFCTEIFQLPDMDKAAMGAMECLKPIQEKVYIKTGGTAGMKHIALIHTVQSVASSFGNTLKVFLDEEVGIHNLWDDFLSDNPNELGEFTVENRNRLFNDIKTAELTGADVIAVTCSTLTPIVRMIRPFVKVPLIAIDDAMAKLAVIFGSKVMILATAESTLQPTRDKLMEEAGLAGVRLTLEQMAVTEAFDAMKAMNMERHDAVLLEAAKTMKGYDCIVLAQASMAHLEDEMARITGCTVLSSPKLCMRQIEETLKTMKENM